MLIGDEGAGERLKESAAVLQGWGARNVIVTLGEQGAFLLEEGGSTRSIPALQNIRAVDTTAAGDSFTGALAYGLAAGSSLYGALELAVRVAGIVVTRKGAQTSMPDMQEILQAVQ